MAQRALRDVKGVSVIVYAQTCAAEKRRRRKKKTLVDPARRVVINEAVCEGCGDCGVQSNCVSILPLETPLGRNGMPMDVAKAIAYLADAEFVTGQVLGVSGGYVI